MVGARRVGPGMQGADPFAALMVLLAFLIIRYGVTKPAVITAKAWQLLATFIATILGADLHPSLHKYGSLGCRTGIAFVHVLKWYLRYRGVPNRHLFCTRVAM